LTDGGPETRQRKLERSGFCAGPHPLTLGCELVRRQVSERAVWSALIVIMPPHFDLRSRIVERRELVHVQALIAESSVERLNEGIFHRFARTNEVELHATCRLRTTSVGSERLVSRSSGPTVAQL
jgi:hypothetical protein